MGLIDSVDTMILGANTYAQPKDYWPYADDQGEYGEMLNNLTKFVASSKLGGGGQPARGDHPAAHRLALRGGARPAYPAHLHQGRDRQPARTRHRAVRRGSRRVAGDRRGVHRPRQQPARLGPPGHRRGPAQDARGRLRRDRRPRTVRNGHTGTDLHRRRRTPAARPGRPRSYGAGRRERRRQRPAARCAGRAATGRCGR